MTEVTLAIQAYLGGAWTDIISDVAASTTVSSNWGMDGNKPLDLLAKTGQLRFSLKNNTGKYTSGGASVIHADWGKGTKVAADFTFDGQTHRRFYGAIDSIGLDAGTLGERKAHVTVLDWMDYAAKYPIQNPAIELDKRADEAITTILAGMPIQPSVVSLDTGAHVFPTVFNDATLKTRAYSEFQKLALSELGRIYHKKDQTYGDTLRFESANARVYSFPVKKVPVNTSTGYILMETGDKILMEDGSGILIESYALQDVTIDNTMLNMDVVYGDNLINRITVSANPTRIATVDTPLFTLDSALFVDAGDTKEFFIQFTEDASKRLVAALPPDTSYPTTLLHFDAPGPEEVVVDEGGKPFDDYDVSLVTNVKKVGVAALYLDGSASYAEGTSSADYEFGSGDFTVEWWEYRFDTDASEAVVCRGGGGGYVSWALGVSDGANSLIYITSNGSSWDIANGKTFGAIATNTWVHYALVRSGSTFYAFKDGVITDTWTSSATILASTDALTIGKSGANYITACIDEMRLTKGFARYTAPFTPTTEPYQLSGLIKGAWTNANGTGTELTDDFNITISYGAAGASVSVENSGTTGGYLTTLKINGKIVETISPVTDIQEDAASIAAYGYHEMSIDQKYQQDFTSGREKAATILDENKVPRVDINRVTWNANRDEAHMQYFLHTDVGDLVNIIEDQTETDASYFIQGMGWDAQAAASGVIVNAWWNVKKFRDTPSPLAIQFTGTSGRSYVEWGYLPQIAVENTPYRIWSFWFYPTTFGDYGNLIGHLSNIGNSFDHRGYNIEFTSTARVLQFWFPSNDTMQRWRSTAIANTTNTWFHMMVAYDSRSILNQPTFYVDGASNTLSSYGTPYSVVDDGELGLNLRFSSPYLTTFYGNIIMKDIRIYNGDQVADPAQLASLLYAEGAHGNANKTGLLFRAFHADPDDLADYTGAYLTEDQKLIDDIGFAIGTPKNAPLGVAL